MCIPLLATLVVSVYAGMTTLPEGKIELYRIFVDLLCGGWDIAKGLKRKSEFSAALKLRIVMCLASRLQSQKIREASDSMLRESVKKTALSYVARWEALISDIIQDGLLIREGKSCTFSHHSFQEYLAARDIADPSSENRLEVIERYLRGDEWWREVVLFCLALFKKPEQLENIISDTVDRLSKSGYFVPKDFLNRRSVLNEAIKECFPGYRTITD